MAFDMGMLILDECLQSTMSETLAIDLATGN